MPIYSDNEAEIEDRLASLLAGAGATSSLAASAAAALKDDPSAVLTPRLRAAVDSMVRVVERAASIDMSRLDDATSGAQFPEELVAKLAQSNDRGEAVIEPRQMMDALLADLRSLLAEPSGEATRRVESFLGLLSKVENTRAQALARGSLELEMTSHARVTV